MPINNMTKEDLDYTVCQGDFLPEFRCVPAGGCVGEVLRDECRYAFSSRRTGETFGYIRPGVGDTLIIIHSRDDLTSKVGTCP